MSQYTAVSVKQILEDVKRGKIILPAMQRNYVWEPRKICDLFDSLASDYPIGTFLFWKIYQDKTKELVFNKFVDFFNESQPIQRGEKITTKLDEYYAVLDGQQRLTSLNIGINGRMHLRKKKRSPKFVDKFLALNVFHDPDGTTGEATNHYSFDFRETSDLEEIPQVDGKIDLNGEYWVPVGKIADDDFDENEYVDDLAEQIDDRGLPALPNAKRKMIRKQLKQVIQSLNNTDAINFYLAETDNLAEVVDIFVRVNSGGQKLSAPDLMLSIASGNSAIDDAQKQISEAIEDIKNTPKGGAEFPADKELIIRAGLMFTGADSLSLSNQDNYSRERIESVFIDHWEDIVESLQNGVRLLEWLGFNVAGMSKNLLLPIAYYLYKKNPPSSYYTVTFGEESKDKLLIKQWVIRAMIRSIFRDGTGSTLLISRNIIDSSPLKHFPLGDFLSEDSARNLRITEDSIDDIMRMSYTDPAVRPLLAILAKKVDVTSMSVDHMWPQSILASKRKVRKYYPNISDSNYSEFKRRMNNICNLQLLSSADNNKKSDELYEDWLSEAFSTETSKQVYFEEACVDPNAPKSFSSFIEFTDSRAEFLRERIAQEFPDNIEQRLFPENRSILNP